VSVSKNKVDGAHHANARPQIIPFERLVHIHERKWHKHDQRDDFLQNLELRQIELREANAVGRHLKAVFYQGDAPTDKDGNPQGLLMQVTQMPIPGKQHKKVGC